MILERESLYDAFPWISIALFRKPAEQGDYMLIAAQRVGVGVGVSVTSTAAVGVMGLAVGLGVAVT